MQYHDISDKRLKEFKEICEKEGIKYETEAEYKEAAQNLVGFFDVLIQMDLEQKRNAIQEEETKLETS